MAARLAESPGSRVLLIEAGGSHKHMNVQVPAAFSKQFKSKLDWSYFSEPEPYLDGRRIFMPRAKMLGGCSSMNAMIYIRGNKADYDSLGQGRSHRMVVCRRAPAVPHVGEQLPRRR